MRQKGGTKEAMVRSEPRRRGGNLFRHTLAMTSLTAAGTAETTTMIVAIKVVARGAPILGLLEELYTEKEKGPLPSPHRRERGVAAVARRRGIDGDVGRRRRRR